MRPSARSPLVSPRLPQWVTGGKTLSGYMFSGSSQVADISQRRSCGYSTVIESVAGCLPAAGARRIYVRSHDGPRGRVRDTHTGEIPADERLLTCCGRRVATFGRQSADAKDAPRGPQCPPPLNNSLWMGRSLARVITQPRRSRPNAASQHHSPVPLCAKWRRPGRRAILGAASSRLEVFDPLITSLCSNALVISRKTDRASRQPVAPQRAAQKLQFASLLRHPDQSI
jgi:hypothetical protein